MSSPRNMQWAYTFHDFLRPQCPRRCCRTSMLLDIGETVSSKLHTIVTVETEKLLLKHGNPNGPAGVDVAAEVVHLHCTEEEPHRCSGQDAAEPKRATKGQ